MYEELLPTETRALHERLAQRLEALPDGDERTIALAHHWRAAGERDRTVRYNEAAGDLAARRLAHHDAARFYERALEQVRSGEDEEARIYEKLGRALSNAEPGQRALRALCAAREAYERAGDAKRAVEVLLREARQHFQLSDPGGYRRAAERAIEIARATSDETLQFAALSVMLGYFALGGDPDGAEPYERAAAELIGRVSAVPARYNAYRGLLYMLRGRRADMHRAFGLALEAARTEPDLHTLPVMWLNYGANAMHIGELDAARESHRTAIRLAEERDLIAVRGQALLNDAQTSFVRGRFDEVRAAIDDVTSSTSSTTPERMSLGFLGTMLGLLTEDASLIERFASDDLLELAFRSGQAQRIEAITVAYAELAAAAGDGERARALLHRGAEAVASVHQHLSLPIAVARHGNRADRPRVRALLARWASSGENPLGEAYLDLFDALVEGATPHARALASIAADRFRNLGATFYEAMAEEAAGRLERALGLYREMGDVRDVRRLEAIVVPRNRLGRAKHELTRREREIAQHLARGVSNRAIAEALVLSERTVETHVASILAKLEVDSRADVAPVLARTSP